MTEVCHQKRHLCTSTITVFPRNLFKAFPVQSRGEAKVTENKKCNCSRLPLLSFCSKHCPLVWTAIGYLCWYDEQVRYLTTISFSQMRKDFLFFAAYQSLSWNNWFLLASTATHSINWEEIFLKAWSKTEHNFTDLFHKWNQQSMLSYY